MHNVSNRPLTDFVDFSFRTDIPTNREKAEAEQRKREKKDAQYIEAQSKFESMDIKALLCLALLEVRKNPNIYNQIKKRKPQESLVIC